MASTWQPNTQTLADVAHVLSASLSSDNNVRRQAAHHLDEAQKLPDINGYLAYILAYATDADVPVRSAAGLLLKNDIRVNAEGVSVPILAYIKESVVRGLGDQANLCRSICGSVITTILFKGGIMGWPEIIPNLMEMLDSSNDGENAALLQDGAFSAMVKICEDSAKALDMDYGGQRPLEYLIPKFIHLTKSPMETVRSRAIQCLCQFIPIKAEPLIQHLDEFLAALFGLATDASADVRKNVCRGLVMLLDIRPDKIAPNLGSIVEYMMYSTQGDDEQVALEACEFWLSVADQPSLTQHLEPYLEKIVPMLLKGMVYSEMDLLALGIDEDDDYNVEDKAEDIKPQFAKTVTHAANGAAAVGKASSDAKKPDVGEDEEEEEEEEDYDDDDDDPYADWNLRKGSAAALDAFATQFHEKILVRVLPYLRENIGSSDWLRREASVLALGAIADGCMDGVVPHLPELYPYLLSLLRDPRPLVRQITCWTLGRYSQWAVDLPTDEAKKQFLEPLIFSLLATVNDKNKRVQEAGYSAFATMEEEAGPILMPYLSPIVQHLCLALQQFQRKALMVVYDGIQTLANAVAQGLNNATYLQAIVPLIMDKWASVDELDQSLLLILECLSAVAMAAGSGFVPYAKQTYSMSLNLLTSTLTKQQAAIQDHSLDVPSYEINILVLDHMSSLSGALGNQFHLLVSSQEPSILQLLQIHISV